MGFLSEVTLGPTFPGFENIFRYYDAQQTRILAKILPGEFYVSGSPDETIVTTLGSCIAVCIRDTRAQLGGMNHFMLPSTPKPDEEKSPSTLASNAYGVFAIESLVNEILKLGGRRGNFEIKVTGGGRIGAGPGGIGDRNVHFIRDFLKTEKLHPVAVDLGGRFSRKIRYNPLTGRLQIKKIGGSTRQEVVEQEVRYRQTMDNPTIWGTLELF